MKLCPQCDFIYEDNQRFCDMDGKELVYDPAAVATEQDDATRLNPTPDLTSGVTPLRLAGRRWRNFAVAAGVFVMAVVLAFYVVRIQQTRLRALESVASLEQSTDRSAVQSTPDLEQTSFADTPSREESREQALEQSPSSPAEAAAFDSSPARSPQTPSKASVRQARLAANPVSTGAASGNRRGRVIVRLSNGAVIEADEAWESKEGIWYRQGGVVTLLRRSQAKTIEQQAPPTAPSNSAANGARKKSLKENPAGRNRLRLARLEPADPKKESRVVSFLKETGRILKKPFKR